MRIATAVVALLVAASAAAATIVDRAPHHCTVFSLEPNGRGHRVDACTHRPMRDLPPGPWSAVRAFADGGYLAARGATLNVFDADDHLIRTLTPQIDPVQALAFDVDPQCVWVATTKGLAKINLASGNVLLVVAGAKLEVYGEQRPASALAAVQDVPSLSPALLFALALGLIALAWQRLRA